MIGDADLDPAPLAGRTVAIIGFGNQGRAQALNLRDSGIAVRVGLRPGSQREEHARGQGLTVLAPVEAVQGADIVALLAPDEHLPSIYAGIEAALKPGAALDFAHGLCIHYGLIEPRADLDVIMVAPKGPGAALRRLYGEGRGMVALAAVAQDATGAAWPLTLAYAQALGSGRKGAGVLRSTFEQETLSDLFNEAAVVWGAVPALLEAGFDTLVEAGIDPQLAYLECVSELKLLADLVEARGIAGMREAISNTAELGASLGGPWLVDDGVKHRMRAVLAGLSGDAFARSLTAEASANYPRLRAERRTAASSALEAARKSLL
ncbi:ketol-acid reductoisomerase [Sphingomonas glaciei]|uniref:Ketol-acid reductoisomerase n=1 Tax=Sphingomonas glaciei TaxID=2938948 RepID=A0ABY5MWN0_9SPHN|nr:ketol-acid reductoisomerase [Sphingomonas glaciei]UUR08863.1 ketol-acid reductoisomerase [Sphingomonas glaciei]